MASRDALSEQAFYVLAALAGEPMHGYAIMKLVGELSDGRVRPRVGTLYGVLDRLVAERLVEPVREEKVGGRVRRYYRMSERGRQMLAEHAARQAANSAVAMSRLSRMGPLEWGTAT